MVEVSNSDAKCKIMPKSTRKCIRRDHFRLPKPQFFLACGVLPSLTLFIIIDIIEWSFETAQFLKAYYAVRFLVITPLLFADLRKKGVITRISTDG